MNTYTYTENIYSLRRKIGEGKEHILDMGDQYGPHKHTFHVPTEECAEKKILFVCATVDTTHDQEPGVVGISARGNTRTESD